MALFTSENAAKMAQRSHEVRKQREYSASLGSLPADPYIAARLSRTRKQLDLLDELFEEETDAQTLDRLASAISRLAELERQLAGRPLPGSLRPSEPKRRHDKPDPTPLP